MNVNDVNYLKYCLIDEDILISDVMEYVLLCNLIKFYILVDFN